MNIEIFTICEYVQPFSGSINMLNPFETIMATKLPVSKTFYVVIRIRYEPESESKKTLNLRFFDPSGKEILEPLSNEAVMPAHMNRTRSVNHIISIENFVFEEVGQYKIVMESEDFTAELPFYVEMAKKQD